MSRVFNPAQNEYVNTPPSVVYNNLPAFTIAAWAYNIGNNNVLWAKDPLDSYTNTLFLTGGGSGIEADVVGTGGDAQSTSSTNLPLNAWAWAVMTFDVNGDKLVHLYINNIEVAYNRQIPISGSQVNDSRDGYYIGGDTFGDTFGGNIAEFAVWNKVLSSSERASAFASTNGVSEIAPANLVGYWHLCGTMSPEPDSSGNGNAGVLSIPPPTQGPDSPGFACSSPTMASKSHLADTFIYIPKNIKNLGFSLLNKTLGFPGKKKS